MFEADTKVKLYLARVIYDAGRPNEASDILRSVMKDNYAFHADEFGMIISIWTDLIKPLRLSIVNLEDMEQPNDHIPGVIAELKVKLNELLDEIILLLSKTFVPQATEEEQRGRYLKALADFERYKLECIDESEILEVAGSARENYLKAIDTFKTLPQQCAELLTASELNYAILLADYLNEKKKAVGLMEKGFSSLSVSLEKYPEDIRGRMKELLDLMAANIERWKPKESE